MSNKHVDEGVECVNDEDDIDCEHMLGEVICPYCGGSQSDIFERADYRDEGESEFTCDGCEKEFDVTTSVHYYFTSHKK